MRLPEVTFLEKLRMRRRATAWPIVRDSRDISGMMEVHAVLATISHQMAEVLRYRLGPLSERTYVSSRTRVYMYC
jgi:hypothetical protein